MTNTDDTNRENVTNRHRSRSRIKAVGAVAVLAAILLGVSAPPTTHAAPPADEPEVPSVVEIDGELRNLRRAKQQVEARLKKAQVDLDAGRLALSVATRLGDTAMQRDAQRQIDANEGFVEADTAEIKRLCDEIETWTGFRASTILFIDSDSDLGHLSNELRPLQTLLPLFSPWLSLQQTLEIFGGPLVRPPAPAPLPGK